MTFDDDFIRMHIECGTVDLLCKTLGFEWPPPERFDLNGVECQTLVRLKMSHLTDEERAQVRHVARGAEYFYERLGALT